MTIKDNNDLDDKTQLGQLLARARGQGTVGDDAQQVLQGAIAGDLGGMVIAGAAGMQAEDIQASEVTLITVVLDRSTSIGQRGLERAVCDGQRLLLDAFAGARERDAVLVALWTFASEARVVHGYVPVDEAERLEAGKSFVAGGATHLYDTFVDACAANVAYAQRLRDSGTPTRSIVVVVTDGEDYGSRRPARAVKKVVDDLCKSEQFTLALVGVGDADFAGVAHSMGIPPNCVLVQRDATASGLRAAFVMVSRSAVRASQGKIAPGAASGFFSP